MATVIDSLLITLGLESSGVSKGMSEVEGSLADGVRNITTNILAPLAGAFAFGALLDNFTSTADALGKLSSSLGINVSDLDAWGQAAQHAGGSSEGFQESITALNEILQEVILTGEGEGKEVFTALGISAKDASGKAKTSVDILQDLAAVAGSMDKAKFAGIAKKLGLDQGTIQLLQSGSKEVNKLVGDMKELAYTQRDAEVAAEFNDVMQDLGKTFQSGASILLRVLVPAISAAASILQKGMAFLRRHEPFVLAFFTALAAVIAAKVTPAIIAMGKAWMANPIAWAIAAIVAIVAALALVFDDLWTYINGGESALADFWAIFGTGEEIGAALKETWEGLKAAGIALWEGVKAAAAKFFSYFRPAFESIGPLVKSVLRLVKAIFTGDFSNMQKVVGDVIVAIATTITDLLSGAFNAVVDLALTAFKRVADFVKGIFGSVGFASPDEVDDVTREVGAGWASTVAPTAPGVAGNAGQLAPPAGARGGPVDNSTTISVTGATTINTQATDAPGIAGAYRGVLSQEINRMVISKNGSPKGR